jgi:ribosome-associated toxin RatA of RatAB toxin-antitoxin module
MSGAIQRIGRGAGTSRAPCGPTLDDDIDGDGETGMRRWLMAALLAAHAAVAYSAGEDQDITVKVVRDGKTMQVDSELHVRANPRDVWDVLTDYDNMARFVSTLNASSIEQRSANRLQVRQHGTVQFGFLGFPFTTVRQIDLVPYTEIRTSVIDGSMKSSQFVTTVIAAADETRIVQHGTVVPDMWIPPGIGPAIIAARTRVQWQEFRAEILRRSANRAQ